MMMEVWNPLDGVSYRGGVAPPKNITRNKTDSFPEKLGEANATREARYTYAMVTMDDYWGFIELVFYASHMEIIGYDLKRGRW